MDDKNDDDTSLAQVPIPIAMTNDNDHSNAECDHNSIDPNEVDDNSSKTSVQSSRSQAPAHTTNDEPPQLPPEEEEPGNIDNTHLPELDTQDPVLHQSKRVSVPLSNYIPKWEARPMP